MTKLRPPLSFHQAITRIGGRLGWERCAEIVGQAERTVRNWSDPATNALPRLDDALLLDAAYRADGAGEAPILAVYGLKLEAELLVPGEAGELADAAACVAKETGEAVAALVQAAKPGAPDAARVIAEKETEEAIASLSGALLKLKPQRASPS